MSDAAQQEISILLPEARIALYSKDNGSLDAAKGLSDDWRFARVGVQVEDGDVDDVIQMYREYASPELLIIQTDTIDEGFTAKLEELASHCGEGTSAIIIGPENDVNLYRRLIDMGVSDYLVKPVETEVLSEVVAKALIEKKGVSRSNLIAVIGAKGGVGASLLSEGLACGVAEILQQKTMLLDTSGGWSSLGVGLGFEPTTTLAEAVKAAESGNEDNIVRMLHSVSERLNVLATGGDVMLDANVAPAQLEALVDMLMVKSPVVVADLSNSPADLQRIILSRANKILLVSTPTLPSLRLTRSLLSEINDVRGGEDDAVELVVNMQGLSAAHEVSKADIEAAVGHGVSAFLPFSPKAFIGNESASKKLTDDQEARGLVVENLLPLVKALVAPGSREMAPAAKGGFMSSLLGKISGGS